MIRRQFELSLESTILDLAQQRSEAHARGERLETNLIPHIRIKLDMIVKAYEHDLDQVIEKFQVSDLPSNEKDAEMQRARKEVADLIYNLKRERSRDIESLFEQMRSARNDFDVFEAEARAEKPIYSIVKSI